MTMNGPPHDPHDGLAGKIPGADSVSCDGSGWLTITTGGIPAPARCPVCARRHLVEAIGEFIPPRFRSPLPLPERVMAWVERGGAPDENGRTGLYIHGTLGTGKTHAAWLAAADWCAETRTSPRAADGQVPPVLFLRVPDLLDALRPQDDRTQMRIRDCQETALLVFDDLGAENPTAWALERLYMAIDHRYAHKLPVIVTTNVPITRLAEHMSGLGAASGPSSRIASRLVQMCAGVKMVGPDRRMGAA
jgi:DNA replication protein DnaC